MKDFSGLISYQRQTEINKDKVKIVWFIAGLILKR